LYPRHERATELLSPDDVEIYVLTNVEAALIRFASEYNGMNPGGQTSGGIRYRMIRWGLGVSYDVR